MSKIAALQLPTLAMSESRLDYYIDASKQSGADLICLGEYVLNSFFTELLAMPKSMIKEQSEAKKQSLIKFAKKYDLSIIAPFISVENKGLKKICLKVSPSGVKSYEQQVLMPYAHWNEKEFFSNLAVSSQNLKLFSFTYNKLKVALLFGFEAHFDIFWKMIREKKIDLVIIPTASTFESNKRWEELLKTRAFLNSVNILRINRIGTAKVSQTNEEAWKFYGDTLFIDAFGQITERLKNEEEMLIIEPPTTLKARKLWSFDKINKMLEG